MNLPTVDRSIRDENASAILRRWSYAVNECADEGFSRQQQWFPGQRVLLEILSVMTRDRVLRMADCGLPLFTIRTPMVGSSSALPIQLIRPQDEMHAQATQEAFVALMCRLDSLRTSATEAEILYDLPSAHANFINRHGPHELHSLASDPSVVLLPAVADEYFLLSATTQHLTLRERTVLAGAARRKLIH